MAKKARQSKEPKQKRQQGAATGGSRVMSFFKHNIYIILMILCVLAIGTMITVAAVYNSDKGDEPVVDVPKDDDVITPPDDGGDVVTPPDDGGDVITPPDDDKPVDKPFLMVAPIDGCEVSKGFSDAALVEDKTNDHWATHVGIDIGADAGTGVKCVFDGVVKSVESDYYYGTVVVITHKDGFETTYKLLDKVGAKVGDTVTTGQQIGEVSATALCEVGDGAHLHLQLVKDGKDVNPLDYMNEGDK